MPLTHFTIDEFACRCGCGAADMQLPTLIALEKFRMLLGDKRVRINSGYRCESHNAAVQGAKNSLHTKGRAVDVAPIDGDWKTDSHETIQAARDAGFTGIGVYNTFIHLDTRDGAWFHNYTK